MVYLLPIINVNGEAATDEWTHK